MKRLPRDRAGGTRRRVPRPRRTTAQPLTILATQLRIGDTFTDEEGDWAITGHPYTMREGKVVHATVQRPDDPASVKERTWGAHERLTVRRAATPARARPGSTRQGGRRGTPP